MPLPAVAHRDQDIRPALGGRGQNRPHIARRGSRRQPGQRVVGALPVLLPNQRRGIGQPGGGRVHNRHPHIVDVEVGSQISGPVLNPQQTLAEPVGVAGQPLEHLYGPLPCRIPTQPGVGQLRVVPGGQNEHLRGPIRRTVQHLHRGTQRLQ